MHKRNAFTMIELIFVIVVIGILAAIAVPKLAATRDDAVVTKAMNTVASVRSALATERQKNILKGVFDDMNKTSIGYDALNKTVFGEILQYPDKVCVNTSDKNCWTVSGTDIAPIYTFKGPTAIGDVVYTLQSNRLKCTSSSAQCKKYGN